MKNKLLILLFVFISLGCKESKTNEVIVNDVNVSKIDLKVEDSIEVLKKGNKNIVKEECFEKIGSRRSDENNATEFKGFSMEAISKDFRTHFVLKNIENTTTYDIDIVLDMGDLYYWAYTSPSKYHIYLLELDNYYSSTFFVLMKKDNNLYNLGHISIDQPNAEEGLKNESFKFCYLNNKLVVETFLDKKSRGIKEFIISSEKIAKEFIETNENTDSNISFTINDIVHAQVETCLNVRSKPNSKGTIVGKAYPKEHLKVLEILDGWLKISFNGTEGYVSSDFVK